MKKTKLKSWCLFSVFFVMAGLGTGVHAVHPDLEVPFEGVLEIVAPATKQVTFDDSLLFIFDYEIHLDERTRYESVDGHTARRFVIEAGQWLEVQARMTAEHVLVAERIRRIKQRPLFVRIQQQKSDTFAFPAAKNPTGLPLKTLLDSEAKGVIFRFHPADRLLVGGKIGQRVRLQDDRDLLQEREDNELGLRLEMQLDLLRELRDNGSFLLVEPQALLDIRWPEGRDTQYDGRGRLARAHVLLGLGDHVAVNAGRIDFEDDRQWFFDEVLDGLRLSLVSKWIHFELAWSVGREWADINNDTVGWTNQNVEFRFQFDENHYVGLWGVVRQDTHTENFSPRLAGLRWVNRPKAGLRHWVDIAAARGEVGDQPIEGMGADIGLNFISKAFLRPYGVVTVAYGSGAETRKQDTAFRQTGLQGNADKFGGLSRFNYYGEVLAPELSNRTIASVGIGLRPTANFSIDTLFHRYRQVETTTDLGETRLKVKPNGRSADLGTGVDIVFSARYQDLIVSLIWSRFSPGEAFDRESPTQLGELGVEYKF